MQESKIKALMTTLEKIFLKKKRNDSQEIIQKRVGILFTENVMN